MTLIGVTVSKYYLYKSGTSLSLARMCKNENQNNADRFENSGYYNYWFK